MILIIFSRKCDLSALQTQNIIVGNCDAARIASQIIQDFGSVLKRWLAVNNPILLRNGIQKSKPACHRNARNLPLNFRDKALS